jgi:hypothetical protein
LSSAAQFNVVRHRHPENVNSSPVSYSPSRAAEILTQALTLRLPVDQAEALEAIARVEGAANAVIELPSRVGGRRSLN